MAWAWIVAAIVLGFLVWIIIRRPSSRPLPQHDQRLGLAESPPLRRTQEVDLVVPDLGVLADEIASALREGQDPNSAISIPHHAHHLAVVGESYDNNNGTSRQVIIGRTEPGTVVFLVPEPDNEHDRNAVRVFVSEGGSATAQIGYLSRDDAVDIIGEIQRGHVFAWLASKRRAQSSDLWGAALFVVRTEPG
jgi:hypothetical protein